MKVQVKAFARSREALGSDPVVELPEGSAMTALLAALRDRAGGEEGLMFDEAGALRTHVVLMQNGIRVKRDDLDTLVLADGDEVAIFPPVAGG
jgi:molybdopterin synthase sulfur carrier subunit